MAVSFNSNLVSTLPPPPLQCTLHPPLGPNYRRVVCSIWQYSILAVIKEAVAPAAIADEEEGSQEDQGTDGAGLPFQQEAEQVEAHEHGVVEPQSWVQRLGNEQHREKPLQTIHCHFCFWCFLKGG